MSQTKTIKEYLLEIALNGDCEFVGNSDDYGYYCKINGSLSKIGAFWYQLSKEDQVFLSKKKGAIARLSNDQFSYHLFDYVKELNEKWKFIVDHSKEYYSAQKIHEVRNFLKSRQLATKDELIGWLVEKWEKSGIEGTGEAWENFMWKEYKDATGCNL